MDLIKPKATEKRTESPNDNYITSAVAHGDSAVEVTHINFIFMYKRWAVEVSDLIIQYKFNN